MPPHSLLCRIFNEADQQAIKSAAGQSSEAFNEAILLARQNAEVKAQNERLELAGSKALKAAAAFQIVEASARQAGIDAAAKMVAEADAAAAAAKAAADAVARAAEAKAATDAAAAAKAAAETAAADAAAKAAFAAAEASHAKAAAERLPAEASHAKAAAEAVQEYINDEMREAVKIVEAKIGDQLPKAKDSSLCKQGCCMDWTEEQKELWNNALNEALVEVRA